MAIVRRTTNGVIETFSGTAGTGHTINLSDAAIGDVRTCEIAGNPDGTGTLGTLTLPSGWSWAGTQTETGAASTGMLSVIYRVVQSGDTLTGASLSLTYNNSVMVAATAETWEGVDNTTPLDQTVPSYATGGSPPVSPSITTQTDGALLICAVNVDGAPTWGDTDIPSGFTLNGTASNNPPSNGQNQGSAYLIQTTAGASGTKSWTNGGSEEYVAMTYALRPAPEGITDVTPDEFDMDNADVDITGADVFDASGNDVYLSQHDTLAGGTTEVDISSAINTEAIGLINLDLTQLSVAELTSLNTLGPGARYIIVVTAASDEYAFLITLHRAEGFVMSAGAGTPGASTSRLAAPSGKTTADFDSGRFEEAANPATTIDITADDYTEVVWSIEAKTTAREVAYSFRVTKSGEPLTTYTVTPQVTISAAAEILVDSGTFTIIDTPADLFRNYTLTASGTTYGITGNDVDFETTKHIDAETVSYDLVGNIADLKIAGAMNADSGTFNITGQDANTKRALIFTADGTTASITGQDVLLTKLLALKLTAESGTYTVTPSTAGTIKAHKILINEGSFVVVSPFTANIIVDHIHGSDSGTYVLTGQDVSFTVLEITTVDAESGSFDITPGVTDIEKAHILEADNGSFVLDDSVPADIIADHILNLDSVAFVLTGQDVTFTVLEIIIVHAETGIFTVTPTDNTFRKEYVLSAENGGFSVTPSSAEFVFDWVMPAESESVIITGQDVTFTVLEIIIVDAESGTFTVIPIDNIFRKDYIVSADSADFSVTPSSADFVFDWIMGADGTSIILTGQDVTFTVLEIIFLDVESGTYIVTPIDTDFIKAYILPANSTLYPVVPSSADVVSGRRLSSDPGLFGIEGQDATVKVFFSKIIHGNSGSYTLIGNDVAFVGHEILEVENGDYDVAGIPAVLNNHHVLSIETGVFDFVGNDARVAHLIDEEVIADPGSFIFTGQDADFRYDYYITNDPSHVSVVGQYTPLVVQYYLPNVSFLSIIVTGTEADLIFNLAVVSVPKATDLLEGTIIMDIRNGDINQMSLKGDINMRIFEVDII